jgi:hypothetical protein
VSSCNQHHHGACDHVHAPCARQRTQVLVDLAQLGIDGIDEAGQVAVAPQRSQCLHDQTAGDIACAVATQSVGHCPQAKIVAHQDRVFVLAPDVALFSTTSGDVTLAHCNSSTTHPSDTRA